MEQDPAALAAATAGGTAASAQGKGSKEDVVAAGNGGKLTLRSNPDAERRDTLDAMSVTILNTVSVTKSLVSTVHHGMVHGMQQLMHSLNKHTGKAKSAEMEAAARQPTWQYPRVHRSRQMGIRLRIAYASDVTHFWLCEMVLTINPIAYTVSHPSDPNQHSFMTVVVPDMTVAATVLQRVLSIGSQTDGVVVSLHHLCGALQPETQQFQDPAVFPTEAVDLMPGQEFRDPVDQEYWMYINADVEQDAPPEVVRSHLMPAAMLGIGSEAEAGGFSVRTAPPDEVVCALEGVCPRAWFMFLEKDGRHAYRSTSAVTAHDLHALTQEFSAVQRTLAQVFGPELEVFALVERQIGVWRIQNHMPLASRLAYMNNMREMLEPVNMEMTYPTIVPFHLPLPPALSSPRCHDRSKPLSILMSSETNPPWTLFTPSGVGLSAVPLVDNTGDRHHIVLAMVRRPWFKSSCVLDFLIPNTVDLADASCPQLFIVPAWQFDAATQRVVPTTCEGRRPIRPENPENPLGWFRVTERRVVDLVNGMQRVTFVMAPLFTDHVLHTSLWDELRKTLGMLAFCWHPTPRTALWSSAFSWTWSSEWRTDSQACTPVPWLRAHPGMIDPASWSAANKDVSQDTRQRTLLGVRERPIVVTYQWSGNAWSTPHLFLDIANNHRKISLHQLLGDHPALSLDVEDTVPVELSIQLVWTRGQDNIMHNNVESSVLTKWAKKTRVGPTKVTVVDGIVALPLFPCGTMIRVSLPGLLGSIYVQPEMSEEHLCDALRYYAIRGFPSDLTMLPEVTRAWLQRLLTPRKLG